ncbi:MAG: hypothetical protein WCY93_11060 [Anaerolineaceae bacterium]
MIEATFGDPDLEQFIIRSAEILIRFYLGMVEPDELLILANDEMEPVGRVFKNGDVGYMIELRLENRTREEIFWTLAHELVHVRQFQEQDLENQLDKRIPYQERWWEIEADKIVNELPDYCYYVTK